jgi:hypothetical protein
MNNENLVHVKLEYNEGLQTKSDILNLEASLLRMLKSARNYHAIRMGELRLKIELYRRLKLSETTIRSLKLAIPSPVIPKILKHENKDRFSSLEFKEKEKTEYAEDNEDLEKQLKEISEKLQALRI